MYVPEAFRETRAEVVEEIIAACPLATLVTNGPDGPEATHLPMLLERSGDHTMLHGHVARANPHWRALTGVPALAIFHGAAAYVTPAWYPSKREHGKVVPTWNYETVHVRGTAHAVEDREWLARQIRALTDHQEQARTEPWSVDDAPEAFIRALANAIVGVEIEVTTIIGKVKASQNRPEADRRGVAEGLAATGEPGVARLVRHIAETI